MLGINCAGLSDAVRLMSCRYLSIPEKDDVASRTVNPKGDNDAPVYNSAVIKGRITSADKGKDSTLIIAYRLADGQRRIHRICWPSTTPVHLCSTCPRDAINYSPSQTTIITEFMKMTKFPVYMDHPSAPKEISIREDELITDVVIQTARANGHKINLPLELRLKKNQNIIKQITHNGQVLKIYHEYFSPENAQTGYWNPSSFMKAFGAHIYLAEEYNPRKIPILFVHGTEGSPHNWIYFYMRLDRSRYQPWFFYYPSGIRLPLAAALLNEELRELQKKYGFQKMAIVAHSVGGLTTRSFLTRFASDKQNNFVKLFVTFATPWSGFGVADASQILIHKSIPVWVDLGTQSAFIKTTTGR